MKDDTTIGKTGKTGNATKTIEPYSADRLHIELSALQAMLDTCILSIGSTVPACIKSTLEHVSTELDLMTVHYGYLKEQQDEQLGDAIRKHGIDAVMRSGGSAGDLGRLQAVLGHAFTIQAASKAISAWAACQHAQQVGKLDVDSGDVVTLADLIVKESACVVELADYVGGAV